MRMVVAGLMSICVQSSCNVTARESCSGFAETVRIYEICQNDALGQVKTARAF